MSPNIAICPVCKACEEWISYKSRRFPPKGWESVSIGGSSKQLNRLVCADDAAKLRSTLE